MAILIAFPITGALLTDNRGNRNCLSATLGQILSLHDRTRYQLIRVKSLAIKTLTTWCTHQAALQNGDQTIHDTLKFLTMRERQVMPLKQYCILCKLYTTGSFPCLRSCNLFSKLSIRIDLAKPGAQQSIEFGPAAPSHWHRLHSSLHVISSCTFKMLTWHAKPTTQGLQC